MQTKFQALKDAMKMEVLERDNVIDALVLALVAKTHVFLLGPPGVAKSLTIRNLISHIDGLNPEDYFETLMMKSSTREEVFGPLDLPALKNGRYAFQTKGYLPTAKIAFLDEIWKANAAILNSLLMASNERLFRNDGEVHPIPLWSMFVASNEMPESEELAAIYDRIPVRMMVKSVQEPGNFISMLKIGMGNTFHPGKIVTWEDIEQAHAEAMQVTIDGDILDAISEIKSDLAQVDIFPSDRRFVQSMQVIQAAAWLDGETTADIEHVRPLRNILWDDQEQQPMVERLLLELANPLDKEAMSLLETIEKLATDLEKTLREKDIDEDIKTRKGVELHNKVEDANEELEGLMKKVEGSKKKSAKLDECKNALTSLTRRLLTKLFDVDEGYVA